MLVGLDLGMRLHGSRVNFEIAASDLLTARMTALQAVAGEVAEDGTSALGQGVSW